MFGSYIHLFSKLGDMKGMKQAMKLGTKYGLALSEQLVACMMSCYFANGRYRKMVKLFDEWVVKSGNQLTRRVLFWKCVALSHMVRTCKDGFEGKENMINYALCYMVN